MNNIFLTIIILLVITFVLYIGCNEHKVPVDNANNTVVCDTDSIDYKVDTLNMAELLVLREPTNV